MSSVSTRNIYGGLPGLIQATALMSISLTGWSMELNVGNPDIELRWDNDLRYNIGMRTQSRNSHIASNTAFQSSDYAFDRGDVVTNRVDLLTQFDLVYKTDHGFRLSAAAWYDDAYSGRRPRNNPGTEPITGLPYEDFNGYSNGKFSSTTKRYYRGPSAEMLDAFVFTKFNLVGAPTVIKLGQFATYWGEAIFANGVAYSQSPVDVRKSIATPGIQAKETFLPVAQLSIESQFTHEFGLGVQVPLDWKPTRFPEGGTYLGLSDFGFAGPDQMVLPIAPGLALPLPKGSTDKGKNKNAYGIKARWNPHWAGGAAFGAYYRKFDEVYPWIQFSGPEAGPMPLPTGYHLAYARSTELYGLSVAQTIAGISLAAELVQRRNTGLNSAPSFTRDGARGDITFLILNGISYFGKTRLFDSATLTAELSGSHVNRVRSNKDAFNAEGYAGCSGDKSSGCSTRNAVAMDLSFIPLWYQVFNGVDLSLPVTYSRGLHGNAADVAASSNENGGTYSVGVSADIHYQHTIALTYNGYYSRLNSDNQLNGSPLRDRGWLSLTLKTSF